MEWYEFLLSHFRHLIGLWLLVQAILALSTIPEQSLVLGGAWDPGTVVSSGNYGDHLGLSVLRAAMNYPNITMMFNYNGMA